MWDNPYPVKVISAAAEDWQCEIRLESQSVPPINFNSYLSPEIHLYVYGTLKEGKVKVKHIDVFYEELIGRYKFD
jgi:hypothetical protein